MTEAASYSCWWSFADDRSDFDAQALEDDAGEWPTPTKALAAACQTVSEVARAEYDVDFVPDVDDAIWNAAEGCFEWPFPVAGPRASFRIYEPTRDDDF